MLHLVSIPSWSMGDGRGQSQATKCQAPNSGDHPGIISWSLKGYIYVAGVWALPVKSLAFPSSFLLPWRLLQRVRFPCQPVFLVTDPSSPSRLGSLYSFLDLHSLVLSFWSLLPFFCLPMFESTRNSYVVHFLSQFFLIFTMFPWHFGDGWILLFDRFLVFKMRTN